MYHSRKKSIARAVTHSFRRVSACRHLYVIMLLRCSLSSQVTVNRVIEQRVSNLHDDEARLLPPIG